jgi:hypothetical protein
MGISEMDYLILSAATKGSIYEGCIYKQQKKYAEGYLGLIVPCRGNWYENTKIKPAAIREGFKQSDIVLWIDADCYVEPPEGLPEGNWDICITDNIRTDHKIRFSAGFILFRKTGSTMQLLKIWDLLNGQAKKDHPALKKALAMMKGKVTVGDMTDWIKGKQTVNYFLPQRGRVSG